MEAFKGYFSGPERKYALIKIIMPHVAGQSFKNIGYFWNLRSSSENYYTKAH
jgi:hypothetical protein